jgi:hypothetical protein
MCPPFRSWRCTNIENASFLSPLFISFPHLLHAFEPELFYIPLFVVPSTFAPYSPFSVSLFFLYLLHFENTGLVLLYEEQWSCIVRHMKGLEVFVDVCVFRYAGSRSA